MDKENKLILYKDDEGKVNVSVRFADEDVHNGVRPLCVIICLFALSIYTTRTVSFV